MKNLFKVVTVVFSTLLLVSCSGSNDNVANTTENGGSTNFTETGKQSITISEDNLEASYEKAKIKFSSNDIGTSEVVTIQKMIPESVSLGGAVGTNYKAMVYDFTLDGKTDFTDLVEITLAYDSDLVDATDDEEASIIAKYYNLQTESYESVDYEIDTSKNEVTILTNHLSKYALISIPKSESYGAFKVINNNSREAYITDINPYYYKFVDSYSAANIINESLDNDMVAGTQAYEAGYNAANEWLGLTAAGNSLATAPFSSSFLTSLSNSFNHLGFGASVLQASIDFGKGDNVALFSNLSKNIVYNVVNYVGWDALQLSFVGVFAIDYSLNQFGTEALSGLEEKWKKVYDECYKDGLAKTHTQWYETFQGLSEKYKDPKSLSAVMETTVYNNVYSGWKSEEKMALCAGAIGMGYNGLSSLTNDIKESISREKFYELMASLQPVFDQLQRKTVYNLRSEYKKQLKKLQDQLNQVVNVQIQETIAVGGFSKYAGYRFRFAPLNDKAIKPEWTGTLDSHGSATGAWRVLGYMQAGSPNKLELFKPTDNPDIATPVKTVEFTTDPPNLVINLGDTVSSIDKPGSIPMNFNKLYYWNESANYPMEPQVTQDASINGGTFVFNADNGDILTFTISTKIESTLNSKSKDGDNVGTLEVNIDYSCINHTRSYTDTCSYEYSNPKIFINGISKTSGHSYGSFDSIVYTEDGTSYYDVSLPVNSKKSFQFELFSSDIVNWDPNYIDIDETVDYDRELQKGYIGIRGGILSPKNLEAVFEITYDRAIYY